MSDNQEQSRKKIAINHNTNNYGTSTSRNIFRYSKEMLLSLQESPLVGIPDNMPPLSLWFGEEAGTHVANKNTLNSSAATRSTDKSIVLGPPKTNFASSLNGGLKRTTDTSKQSRSRQLEDSVRTHNNRNEINNSHRMARGAVHMDENGSHHYHQTKNGLERRSSNTIGNQSTHNKRYHNPDHQHKAINSSSSGGRKDFNHDQRSGNRQYHSNHNDTGGGHGRVPEWLDYDPDIVTTSTHDDQKAYANDLEAWKASMKKKDGLEVTTMKEPPSISQGELPTQEDSSNSVEKILDLGTLDLQFISTSTDEIAPPSLFSPPCDLPTERGSRFAKFFAKREEATQSPGMPPSILPSTVNDSPQPRSISVNDLFQMPGNNNSRNHNSPPDQQLSTTLTATKPNPTDSNSNMYPGMMSEVEVLKRLGASNPAQSVNDSNSMGFNKVLQILSQPKPTAPLSSPSSSPDVSTKLSPTKIRGTLSQEKMLEHNGNLTETRSALATTQKSLNSSDPETRSPSISHIQQIPMPTETAPTTTPKKINNLFSGNLPTSVLRQMSARSEGRSPSLSSNKTGQSGGFSTTSSQNGSSSSVPMAALHQQYQYQQTPSPSYHTPHRTTHSQRYDGMSTVDPSGHDTMHTNISRTLANPYDRVPPYGSGPPPNRIPPFMPMDRSFVPPPIMPAGPHPMMSPHLPMHPQITGLPPFMPMPPLGMPQQMYNTMNHGWNHR